MFQCSELKHCFPIAEIITNAKVFSLKLTDLYVPELTEAWQALGAL